MPECRVIQIALVMHTNLTNMIAVHPQVLFQHLSKNFSLNYLHAR